MALALKDTLQKMPVKARVGAFVGVLAILFGAFVYFFHIPKNSEIKELEKYIAEKQKIVNENESKIRRLAELKAKLAQLNENLRLLKEKLPPETEVSTLLLQIQDLVNKSKLTLKLWKPEARRPHASGFVEEIPITVTLIGGYHNVGVFLDRVSKLPRIVNVQNLKMDGAKVGPMGDVNINISCTALTFAATEMKVEEKPAKKAPAKKAPAK